jgi:hypothetical protein
VRSIELQSANISFDQKFEKIEIGLLHAYWQINRTWDLKNLLETTITSCRFNGKECPKNSLTAFVDNLDTRSLCYRFNEYRSENSPSVLSVDRPGKYFGLHIEMYLKVLEYTRFGIPNPVSDGVRVQVHDNHRNADTVDFIDISTGTHTAISVNKLHEIKLPDPFNKCIQLDSVEDFDSLFYKSTFNKLGYYNQK